jgi:ElaB/YqjD/DUF883 family membrane-anchored ribosome-binding protein
MHIARAMNTSPTRKTKSKAKTSRKQPAATAVPETTSELAERGRDVASKLEEIVREQPLVAVASAGLIGAVAGGLVFSRAGRLVFLAAASFVATEVWKQEGRFDVKSLLDKLTREDDGEDSKPAR